MPLNRNLEAMARQLYDYWFVQFDFPDENGRPYKSSGGKMVWNEKLKQEIPEGWCIETLGKLANFRNGINYSKGETGTVCSIVNVRNISASSLLMDGEEFDKIEIANGKEQNYYISDEDIIIARSGCPGATRILWQPNNTIFCGFIICCKPNDIDYRFLITFKLKQLEGTSATQSGGSILQNVSQDTLKRVLVLLPNRVVLSSFNQVIKELLLKLYLSINETQLLEHQRDHLLPLLMNGQVSVMPREVNCDLVFISLMKSIVYNHCLGFLLHMSSCIRNCLNLLRKKNIIKNLSGILRFFLAASAKFRQSKPKGFSFLNSRNHLKNNSQTSSKINLNSF